MSNPYTLFPSERATLQRIASEMADSFEGAVLPALATLSKMLGDAVDTATDEALIRAITERQDEIAASRTTAEALIAELRRFKV